MEDPRVLAMTSSSSSSSSWCSSFKRARAPTNGTETTMVRCVRLMTGCISDLNKCRDYHRRHKVCEVHSKKPKVMIVGREQRFCQECSRFHLLVEFDEAKRSCRKRLDGHNRRRRKLQLEPFTISSESLLSNHQGQVSGTSLDHSITLARPLVATGLQYNNGLSVRYLSPGMEDEPMDSVFSPVTSEPKLHSQSVFHICRPKMGQARTCADSPRTLPFSWE